MPRASEDEVRPSAASDRPYATEEAPATRPGFSSVPSPASASEMDPMPSEMELAPVAASVRPVEREPTWSSRLPEPLSATKELSCARPSDTCLEPSTRPVCSSVPFTPAATCCMPV